MIVLRDYQENALEAVRRAYAKKRRAPLLVLPTGAGKCLGEGTPVLMADGAIKPVESIRTGEHVMGPDGRPRRVVSTCSGEEMLYRVTPVKGDPYVVNESHILSLRSANDRIINVSVRQLWHGRSVHFTHRDGYMVTNNHNGFHGWRVPGVLDGNTEPELVGIKVEPIGAGKYYGFELDGPDRLFMLGDFTVTHNTVCFSYVSMNAAAKGNRVLILVHRQELLRQTSDALTALGVSHGLIAAGMTMQLTKPVQVASVQTVVRRFNILDKAGWVPSLIVVDESHHATAGSWRKVLDHWPNARTLGVTATPCRLDGKGLGVEAGGVFDELVEGPQLAELIERGFLTAPDVYAPPMRADLSGIRSRMGDFAKDQLAERLDKPTVTGDAVAHYSRICPGAPAIAFCVSVSHAEHVAEQFRAAGWKAASLDGSMPDGDRKQLIDDLANGRLHVLTSCDIISEGTDIPVVTAAILLRPTKSLSLYLQQVGRVLRPVYAPGFDLTTDEGRLAAIEAGPKPAAIILDHVGNVQTHMFPDDPREWSLEGTVKGNRSASPAGPPPPITCDGCFRQIRAPFPSECPSCGKALRKVGDRMEKLQHQEGELQKMTSDDKAAIRRQQKREQAEAESMQDLVTLAIQRGYKNPQGWAWKVWSNRGGKRKGLKTG